MDQHIPRKSRPCALGEVAGLLRKQSIRCQGPQRPQLREAWLTCLCATSNIGRRLPFELSAVLEVTGPTPRLAQRGSCLAWLPFDVAKASS